MDDAGWDAALKRALDRLERLRWQADTPARERTCTGYREVLGEWHRRRDQGLLDAVAYMETTARRWRAERAAGATVDFDSEGDEWWQL